MGIKVSQGITRHRIMYGRVNSATDEVMVYADSDFARDLDKRMSITGFVSLFVVEQ